MIRARRAFDKAGISLEELGQKMGYAPEIARKSAWQFLNKTDDPRISMLRKFAKAMEISVSRLIGPKE